jgi:hypothetical protein
MDNPNTPGDPVQSTAPLVANGNEVRPAAPTTPGPDASGIQNCQEAGAKNPSPVLVRVLNAGELSPFEQQTIDIARRTYRLTALAGVVAIVVAIFVYVQMREVADQNQILAAQTESAAAGAAIDELNVRRQLEIAQQQAQAAQASVAAVNRQTRTEQRPWVMPPPGGPLRPMLMVNSPVATAIVIQNTGKTAAIGVEAMVGLDKAPYRGRVPLGAGKYEFSGTIFPGEKIPPVQVVWGRFAEKGRPGPTDKLSVPILLTSSDYRDLIDGRAFFMLRGIITYKDVFGIRHWTKFCYGMPYSRPPEISPNVKNCATYNSVDGN